jgi:segregation and condensation protein A
MPPPDTESLVLSLEGFEGPLDLLLELARAQKFDLARVSILAIVEQYLAFVEGARRIRLELAADWLVMAAWLAWLKSKLLLPVTAEAAEEGGDAADALAARLRELEAMRAAAAWLGARAQLGQDVFARGSAESLVATDNSGLAADMPALLRGYLDAIRRVASSRVDVPRKLTLNFWSVQNALARLSACLGRLPPWSTLEAFLPDGLSGAEHKAAMASTLIASLELARGGGLLLRQDEPFGAILLAPGAANENR